MFPKTSRKKKLRIQGGIVLRYFVIIGYPRIRQDGVQFLMQEWLHVKCVETPAVMWKKNNRYCFVIPAESHPVIFHFCSTCVSYYSY